MTELRVAGLIAITFIALLSACGREAPVLKVDLSEKASNADLAAIPRPEAYRFGFDLRSYPQEDSRQYQPLLDYLSRETGLNFTLSFVRTDKPVAQQIAEGSIDFAASGAVTTIKAMRTGAAVPLVRGLSKAGRSTYKSAIVVANNSPAIQLADLRGKRFAFGDKDSTQGHLVPRMLLKDAQISLTDLSSVAYTGSHLSCAEAVIFDKADACGMQDVMAAQLAAKKKLRVLQYSTEVPSSGVIASAKLSSSIREKVRRALTDFSPQGKNAEGLYNWERTEMAAGFVTANPDDYRLLEAAMIAHGLIEK